jgi:hypothetical protein
MIHAACGLGIWSDRPSSMFGNRVIPSRGEAAQWPIARRSAPVTSGNPDLFFEQGVRQLEMLMFVGVRVEELSAPRAHALHVGGVVHGQPCT